MEWPLNDKRSFIMMELQFNIFWKVIEPWFESLKRWKMEYLSDKRKFVFFDNKELC